MTLLSIVADASAQVGLIPPTVVVGNNTPEVVKMLALANRVGRDLVARGNWGALRTQYPFDATPGEEQLSAFPSDFLRMLPETFWDRTNRQLIAGPIPAAQWQGQVATNDQAARWFALRGGKMYIYPGCVGGEDLYYEYMSGAFCRSAGGTAQTAWAADTDVERLNADLFVFGIMALYLRGEGLPWEMAAMDYEAKVAQELTNDQPRATVLVAGDIFGGNLRHWDGTPASAPGFAGNGSLGLPLS